MNNGFGLVVAASLESQRPAEASERRAFEASERRAFPPSPEDGWLPRCILLRQGDELGQGRDRELVIGLIEEFGDLGALPSKM